MNNSNPPARNLPAYDKPLPAIEPGAQPYWDALRRHELIYQKCRSCGTQFSPYQPLCPQCWSEEVDDRKSSGRGRVYTFSIVYRAPMPSFKADLPYAVAIVELDEGFFMTTNIIGCPPDQVRIGMPVEVEFVDATDDITLPKFRPLG